MSNKSIFAVAITVIAILFLLGFIFGAGSVWWNVVAGAISVISVVVALLICRRSSINVQTSIECSNASRILADIQKLFFALRQKELNLSVYRATSKAGDDVAMTNQAEVFLRVHPEMLSIVCMINTLFVYLDSCKYVDGKIYENLLCSFIDQDYLNWLGAVNTYVGNTNENTVSFFQNGNGIRIKKPIEVLGSDDMSGIR